MPNNRIHKHLWQMSFGVCGYPYVPIDKQMDEYSQKLPGIRHRLKDHDPLRTGDYEEPEPENNKWRIMYRLYHIATDWWYTELSKSKKTFWNKRIKDGNYPAGINMFFWKIIKMIATNPLSLYEILPWKCEPLPDEWIEYIKENI